MFSQCVNTVLGRRREESNARPVHSGPRHYIYASGRLHAAVDLTPTEEPPLDWRPLGLLDPV